MFAGFYVVAQVIERLMQLVSPPVPFWKPYAEVDPDAVKAADAKADRGPAVLGIASVLGVAASCRFGLFFLVAIGMHVSHTIDCFFTGITIAPGTNPLHDFISLIQNQNTPTAGTATTQAVNLTRRGADHISSCGLSHHRRTIARRR